MNAAVNCVPGTTRSFTGVLTTLALLLFAIRADAQQLADDIENLVRPHVDAGLLSGVILVAHGEDIVFQQGYGFAEWEHQVANMPGTRLGIGSITKAFTENVTDALLLEGRVSLTDPVEKYIPEFPRGPAGGIPNVGHLLNHRAGVPHRVTSAIDETQPMNTVAIVSRVAEQGLLFEPGSERLYSSAGFTTLARVLEIATNAPFDQLLVRYVLGPARMTSTRDESGQLLMAGRAMPYRLGAEVDRIAVKKAPYKDLGFLTGAGSVYSTAADLRRYVDAIDKGVFGAAARAGLFGDNPNEWRGIYGRTNGYEASVDVLPGERTVLIILANLQSASTGQVRAQLQALLTGRAAAAIPLPPDVNERFEDPQEIVGAFGRADIRLINGDLFRGENEFYAIEGGSYFIPASGTRMRFRRNTEGIVDALVSTSLSGRESILERSPD